MKRIPKIIHQIWSGIDEPLPNGFRILGNTWKNYHPTWEYILWDNQKMNDFILEYYPQYWEIYNSFHYNVQRWDAIRYLILDKIGGVYVDFDSECLKPLDKLLENKECCFSLEPEEHQKMYHTEVYFNNALMASIPEHPFMKKVIEKTFNHSPNATNATNVLHTTGPLMLVDLYMSYEDKENIYLIPPQYTSPLTKKEGFNKIRGVFSEEIKNKLKDAYSIHYFFNGWVSQL
ncbi:MAG: hypothetical protein LBV43_05630 [Prevotella sp.]|jgi:mannosyltransferase OCH1-like enzyme|nr:hypothetical protein [Prevotella sp.]